MPSSYWFAADLAVLMAGLFIQVLAFYVTHIDPIAIYRLFAVRDKLIRLEIEGKISRDEPHFDTLYRELNMILRSSRSISGPNGWPLASAQGKYFAHHPCAGYKRTRMSSDDLPEAMRPITAELRDALLHLLRNHQGIYLQINARRREIERMRRDRARELLERMPPVSIPNGGCPT